MNRRSIIKSLAGLLALPAAAIAGAPSPPAADDDVIRICYVWSKCKKRGYWALRRFALIRGEVYARKTIHKLFSDPEYHLYQGIEITRDGAKELPSARLLYFDSDRLALRAVAEWIPGPKA